MKQYIDIIIIFIAGVFFLAGCGGYSRKDHSDVHPDDYITKMPERPDKDISGPVTLDKAIAFAMENNRTLRAVYHSVLTAKSGITEARSFYVPKIEADAAYGWLDKQPGVVDPDTGASFLAGEKSSFNSEEKIIVPLCSFGLISGSNEKAELNFELAGYTYERAEKEIVYLVTEAYFNVLRAIKMEQVMEESKALARAHLELAGSYYDEGMVDRKDKLQAELRLAETEQAYLHADNNLKMSISSFNTCVGIGINNPTQFADTMESFDFKSDLDECFSSALENRQELSEMRKGIEIVLADLKITRSNYLPKIYAVASHSHTTDDYQLNEDQLSMQFAVKWEFDGLRTAAQSAQLKEKVKEIEERCEDMTDKICLEVKKAYLDLGEAEECIAVSSKSAEQALENMRIVQDQYNENIIPYTDLLAAETLLEKENTRYCDALYSFNTAVAMLERAIGRKIER